MHKKLSECFYENYSGICLSAIILWIVLLTGCATKIGVRPVDLDDRFVDMGRSALTSDSLSERTTLFLRQRDLTQAWKDDPEETL